MLAGVPSGPLAAAAARATYRQRPKPSVPPFSAVDYVFSMDASERARSMAFKLASLRTLLVSAATGSVFNFAVLAC